METVKKIRVAGWVFVVVFLFVASMNYIPGFVNDNGLLFGLFKLDLEDDIIHLISAVWAIWAVSYSTRQTIFYFIGFGTYYILDAVFYLVQGGLGTTNLALNIPHVLLGVTLFMLGVVWSRSIEMRK